MSRTLSKLFVKLNLILYAVNFAVLFVAMILLFQVTQNNNFFMIPGIFICALICLVYPDFFNMVAGLFGWQQNSSPTAAQAFDHIKQIVDNALHRDYSFLKDNGIIIATLCVVICWLVGIVGMFQQARLNKIVNSPMDWYKRKSLSTYIYAIFGLTYGATMCIGSWAVLFAKEPLTGGFRVLAAHFLICGVAILAGVVLLIVDRLFSVAIFNGLSLEEQVKVCQKQAKYMNKGQRKRQVRRLGKHARTTAQLPQDDDADNKKSKGKKGKQQSQSAISTVEPIDIVEPTNTPAAKQPIAPPTDVQIAIVTNDVVAPTESIQPTDDTPPSGKLTDDTPIDQQN